MKQPASDSASSPVHQIGISHQFRYARDAERPYSASDDKDFASWAPREGDPGAPDYLAMLLRMREQRRQKLP
jgi:hypothetical protein